ncbi:MAG: efflux RND transporter periplasmic adaptor subunit [Planctomycetes bacterium]|nr:efflux RND transporter periplasmic adaptor subunit [Planctomycetota bacterium]MCB9868850.1 efflux RND transporter periplasmic adaptor subunit [Planctomycetota bacterium]MCB9889564.1 efflux RND transporter periplasmic adaptor subunit [Planctomycetota bacterium]
MKRNTVLSCLAIIAVTALIVWWMNRTAGLRTPATPVAQLPLVRCITVNPVTQKLDVTTQGTVAPQIEIDLVAQIAGEVEWVAPSLVEGGFFAEGEVLVRIDKRDYELEVVQAAAQVAQADLVLSRESAEADIAKREWQALGKGKPTALTLRTPQVNEAKAALAAAKATLAKATLRRDRATIRAPFAGRVRRKGVDAHQFVSIGSVLARVYSIAAVEVRLPLHDEKLRFLDLPPSFRGEAASTGGPAVTLRAQFAGRTHEWSARLVRTEGEIDPKTRMIHVVARADDPYGRLPDSGERPPLAVGMFVTAVIHGREFKDVVEVPRSAVRGDGEVLVVDANSQLHPRRIHVLFADDSRAVLDEGLSRGERVCLSPISAVFEGMRVEVIAEPTPAGKATVGGDGGR